MNCHKIRSSGVTTHCKWNDQGKFSKRREGSRRKSPASLSQKLKGQNNKTKNKDQDAEPVDAMHITDPFAFWAIRILFFEIKIFRNLRPDSHVLTLMFCKIKTD